MFEKNTEYKICTKCVMDTSDEQIEFNIEGVCNHCLKFETISKASWFPGKDGELKWREIVERIKSSGKGKDYDCILGLSGGVDSSYLAIKLKDWGLRPLVVHVDAGWNSELAVANIESVVKHCGYDLHTHVVDWEEMRDLHLSYLRAGISNQDVPQDHIFFSSLYHFAIKNGIECILSGGNLATEGVFPDSWHGTAMDAINLKAIHNKYGTGKIKNYKTISFFQYYIWYPLFRKMRTVRPLNFMPYDKELALEELKRTVGYKPYARKHGESQFTKLFQNYYLPVKFGYDKRRPHFASLIVSGQMTREAALEKLNEPLYDAEQLELDISYFCKKLRISRAEFEGFMNAPIHHYTDFPNWEGRYRVLKWLQSFVARVTGKRLSVYS
ncbi:N-acetyl sugar amidotransferase [Pseudomonas fluorescens]|uniref:N-acetyl sugar amidotransferase n=1 Tax=Pseudomonas fluorescens TaxID=294 RepID=UPI001782682B|nr:N-acetyl sugar amidotransferase [Pseudomonas fluorescens]MBD8239830.1 N-acetyl sugar amidotransferase [Pseudomonas fluorescens]MDY0897949.1 N-acetyl sugar amidotransferase [Pseudomonas fluorescens]